MNAARNYINLQKRNKDGKLKDKYRQLRKKETFRQRQEKEEKSQTYYLWQDIIYLNNLRHYLFLVWGTYKLLNKKNKTDNNTEVTEIVKTIFPLQ